MSTAAGSSGPEVGARDRDAEFARLLEALRDRDPVAYEHLIALLFRMVHEK